MQSRRENIFVTFNRPLLIGLMCIIQSRKVFRTKFQQFKKLNYNNNNNNYNFTEKFNNTVVKRNGDKKRLSWHAHVFFSFNTVCLCTTIDRI